MIKFYIKKESPVCRGFVGSRKMYATSQITAVAGYYYKGKGHYAYRGVGELHPIRPSASLYDLQNFLCVKLTFRQKFALWLGWGGIIEARAIITFTAESVAKL